MSAYTPMNDTLLARVLEPFGLQPIAWQVAVEGIENSNFFVSAQDRLGKQHECVLTLFEHFGPAAIPWFIELLDRLAELGLPVPRPMRAADRALLEVAGKPAVLVPRLTGNHPEQPTLVQCEAIGAALGKVHQCRIAPATSHPGPAAQLRALTPLVSQLPVADRRDAKRVLQHWAACRGEHVLCHGDLFRDNALFTGNVLTGLLDFYNAGHELAVWDLAVVANDWCLQGDGEADALREDSLLRGYASVRTLASQALALLPLAGAVAALRFWLSRLRPAHAESEGRGSKDPEEFAAIFRKRLAQLPLATRA